MSAQTLQLFIMKPVFKTLKYIGPIHSKGHMYAFFTPEKEYEATLCKILRVHNYWIINDIGERILVSNNARRKYFKSYSQSTEN